MKESLEGNAADYSWYIFNPKPKGMCTFLLNIQSLLYLLHLAKRLCQEENPSKVEAINNNGVFIDINSVLIDIDGVLIDIDSVLIDINGVIIDIDVQPLTIITTVESKTTNPDHFFSQPFEYIGANGKVKKHPGWGDQLLETDEDNFDSDFVN
jgi:hypothetical protein